MKDKIGPIMLDTPFHREIVFFARALARRFNGSESAYLGKLIKLDEKMREAMETPEGMVNLVIDVKKGGG